MPVDPAQLKILHYPAPQLRAKARPIESINDHVRDVARRMIELMCAEAGVGLAGPQVGLSWRLFVTAIPADDPPHRVYVNPVVSPLGDERVTSEEGCLSLPGIHIDIDRVASVSITALDLDGGAIDRHAEGFTARVWQHEFDHLNGTLIIDRMSPMDQLATRKLLKEMRASATSPSRNL